ncbi:putative fimbrial-like protein YfcQ [Pantoea ananatis]|uniref:Fimbrial-like protein YfcQ n=2 Tax=Pantoea ananas TaxID=553 RepID=A0AAJ1FV69_PANAN|nr:putative fimbrial-like protein YfcQ [Pantoea ananatis]
MGCIKHFFSCLLSCVFMFSVTLPDVAAAGTENLEFRGTLIEPPPCNLSEAGTIKVNFGDRIGVKKVASGIYRQSIPVTLHCEQNSSNAAWQLMLSVSGSPASFDTDNATVVTAEREALGVKLYADGKPLVLDSPVKVNGTTMPALEAVLVQKEGEVLEEGAFTARATLRVAYE